MPNATMDVNAVEAQILERQRKKELENKQDFHDLCLQWASGTCGSSTEVEKTLERTGHSFTEMKEKAALFNKRLALHNQLLQATDDNEAAEELTARNEAEIKAEDQRRAKWLEAMEPKFEELRRLQQSARMAGSFRQELGTLPYNPEIDARLKELDESVRPLLQRKQWLERDKLPSMRANLADAKQPKQTGRSNYSPVYGVDEEHIASLEAAIKQVEGDRNDIDGQIAVINREKQIQNSRKLEPCEI